MAINIDREAHVQKEKIEVKMTVYEVSEQTETEDGYNIIATRDTGLKKEEILLKYDEMLWADYWVVGELQEDGKYRAIENIVLDYDHEKFLEDPFYSYVLIGKGEAPDIALHEIEVDIHPGRHLVTSKKCLEVIDFWNAASEARKLMRWDSEEETEIPGTFDEESMGKKLFPYVKLGDVALKAVRIAAEGIYNFDFDRKDFMKRLKEDPDTEPLANKGDVKDIATLACVYLYEELCFEDGNFAGLDKARDRLESAIPYRVANYSFWEGGRGNLIIDAENMFLDVHPAIAEICEKCILDKRIAIEGSRRERSKKSIEFFNSLPEEIKEIVEELRPIRESLGNFHMYRTNEPLRYEYRNSDGDMRLRYITIPTPEPDEARILEKRERELKAKASLLLEKHGIKGTAAPFLEPEKFVDPAEETCKKRERIEGQRKRFC